MYSNVFHVRPKNGNSDRLNARGSNICFCLECKQSERPCALARSGSRAKSPAHCNAPRRRWQPKWRILGEGSTWVGAPASISSPRPSNSPRRDSDKANIRDNRLPKGMPIPIIKHRRLIFSLILEDSDLGAG
ncbi:hypothetical protein CC2G_011527 [Coprinopsis cinerea AmutBmut pab1-1]|nr:hypothetical protein CC2G_011527 [Coprinopsis cinerea AmutBmut pab1-1]